MSKLTRDDLYSLEQYAELRPEMRAQVMEHKKPRRVQIGDHANLYFEDKLTMQYQLQEMLRIEKIFEAEGIQEELDAYNPLIPDGSNWKATFMLEYGDPEVRAVELTKLIGIEDTLWVQVEGHDKVRPIANEDLERSTEEKTSSVHFLRFELSAGMIEDLQADKGLSMGIAHPHYDASVQCSEETRTSLTQDFASRH